MASSNVGYSGQVTVKVTNKSPVVRKNAGSPDFFNLLARIISGQNTWGYDELPSSIDIHVNSNGEYSSILLSPLSISQKIVSSSEVKLYALLNGSNTQKKDTNGYAKLLLINNAEKTLAEIQDFDLNDISEVLTDNYAQCKIEWTMTFGNINSEEEDK